MHALLAPAEHVDAAQIVALGRRLRVPTLSLAADDDTYETRGGEGSAHINVHVPARLIGRAVAEIVTNFRWRSFTVLYDRAESRRALSPRIQTQYRLAGTARSAHAIITRPRQRLLAHRHTPTAGNVRR